MTEYQVIASHSLEELVVIVRGCLIMGWSVTGGVSAVVVRGDVVTYMQAMVRDQWEPV